MIKHSFFPFHRNQKMEDAAHFSYGHGKNGCLGHGHRLMSRNETEDDPKKQQPADFLADLAGRRSDHLPATHELSFQQTGQRDQRNDRYDCAQHRNCLLYTSRW